jgi:NAD/NADP transhydrogenase beta subunit
MVARAGGPSTFARFVGVSTTQDGRRSTRLTAIALVLAGAVLVLISFRFLDWYDVPHRPDSTGDVTFARLHDNADQLSGVGTATAYFDWLAWVLLILLIGVGIAANLSAPMTDALRIVGFLLGVLGVAATYFAIAQLHNAQVAAGAQQGSVFHNSSWGMWAVFIGYLAAAAGAAIGPRGEER